MSFLILSSVYKSGRGLVPVLELLRRMVYMQFMIKVKTDERRQQTAGKKIHNP
jgi:hypothetical protein